MLYDVFTRFRLYSALCGAWGHKVIQKQRSVERETIAARTQTFS